MKKNKPFFTAWHVDDYRFFFSLFKEVQVSLRLFESMLNTNRFSHFASMLSHSQLRSFLRYRLPSSHSDPSIAACVVFCLFKCECIIDSLIFIWRTLILKFIYIYYVIGTVSVTLLSCWLTANYVRSSDTACLRHIQIPLLPCVHFFFASSNADALSTVSFSFNRLLYSNLYRIITKQEPFQSPCFYAGSHPLLFHGYSLSLSHSDQTIAACAVFCLFTCGCIIDSLIFIWSTLIFKFI